MIIRLVAACLMISAPVAAEAGTGARVPEPGDAAVFMLAVAGLIIGRQASKRPPSAK